LTKFPGEYGSGNDVAGETLGGKKRGFPVVGVMGQGKEKDEKFRMLNPQSHDGIVKMSQCPGPKLSRVCRICHGEEAPGDLRRQSRFETFDVVVVGIGVVEYGDDFRIDEAVKMGENYFFDITQDQIGLSVIHFSIYLNISAMHEYFSRPTFLIRFSRGCKRNFDYRSRRRYYVAFVNHPTAIMFRLDSQRSFIVPFCINCRGSTSR